MKKIISITLTICMLLANSVVFAKDYTQKFWDVDKSHWAFEAIAELTDRGVINGYNDGSFKPEETISRAEWAKIMIDAAGKDASNNNVYFYDMANHWANKYVNAAEKYLPGTNGGFYLPDQAATREEVTVALVKICGYDKSYDYFGYLTSISDVDTILANNRPYINTAIKNNLGIWTTNREEGFCSSIRKLNIERTTTTTSEDETKTEESLNTQDLLYSLPILFLLFIVKKLGGKK